MKTAGKIIAQIKHQLPVKIGLAVFFILAFIFGILFFLFFNIHLNEDIEQSKNRFDNHLHLVSTNISWQLSTIAAENKSLANYISIHYRKTEPVVEKYYLKSILSQFPDVEDLFVVLTDPAYPNSREHRKTYTWYLNQNDSLKVEQHLRYPFINETPAFAIAGQLFENRIYHSECIIRNELKTLITLVSPLVVNGRFIGISGINSTFKIPIFDGKDSIKHVLYLLYNNNNQLICKSNTGLKEDGPSDQQIQKFLDDPNNESATLSDCYIVKMPVKIQSIKPIWKIVLITPQKQLKPNHLDLLTIGSLILTTLIGIVLFIFLIIHFRFSKPVIRLLNNVDSLIQNQLKDTQTDKYLKEIDSSNLPKAIDALSFNLKFSVLEFQKQSQNLLSTLKSLPDLYFEIDKNGVIHDYHVPIDMELYLPPDQWKNRPISEFLPEESLDPIFGALAEAAREGIHHGAAYPLNIKNKTHWYELSVVRKGVNKGNETLFTVLVRDITRWKKVEYQLKEEQERYSKIREKLTESQSKIRTINDELVQQKEKASESDRLKLAFLANMSHEIRTPMNAIIGISELLAEDLILPNERQFYQQLVQSRAEDLMTIIDDILDISCIETGSLRISETEGNLDRMLNEVKEYFRFRIQRKKESPVELQITNQLEEEHNLVYTDFLRIKQVLLHLIDNAFKFTQQGYVEAGCRLHDADTLLFWVKDTGIGIDSNVQSNVFKLFRQAFDPQSHVNFGGTGLGLSIAKGVITEMKGQIWFETESNVGTTFFFTIPYKPLVNNSFITNSKN